MVRHTPDNDKKPRARQDGARKPRPPRGEKPDARGASKGDSRADSKTDAPKRTERIAKAMARAGIASRREVERLIGLGRVAVNGRILATPAVLVTRDDVITVDGKPIGAAQATRVWRYHKPAGLVTSHNDPQGRPTVFDALPSGLPRVISVGRLDLNTEGLLLLTNDGELSRALELPTNGLVRHYRARARGRVTQAQLDRLKDGVTIDGERYGPIEAVLDKAREARAKETTDAKAPANLWISVTVAEGKYREVRKVLESVGLTVNRLIRLAYGPFQLGTLPSGSVEEVGPRVIREQLSQWIAPENLPTGNSVETPAPIPGRRSAVPIVKGSSGSAISDPSRKPSRVRAAETAAKEAAERPDRPVKKDGWARSKPKFEHKKTFKPRDRAAPAEGGEDRPQRSFRPRDGEAGDRPKRPFKPRDGEAGDRPRRPFKPRDGAGRDGAPRADGDRPKRDFKPRTGGAGGADRPRSGPRTGGKPGGKPGGRPAGPPRGPRKG